jgi:hypothetical protein
MLSRARFRAAAISGPIFACGGRAGLPGLGLGLGLRSGGLLGRVALARGHLVGQHQSIAGVRGADDDDLDPGVDDGGGRLLRLLQLVLCRLILEVLEVLEVLDVLDVIGGGRLDPGQHQHRRATARQRVEVGDEVAGQAVVLQTRRGRERHGERLRRDRRLRGVVQLPGVYDDLAVAQPGRR